MREQHRAAEHIFTAVVGIAAADLAIKPERLQGSSGATNEVNKGVSLGWGTDLQTFRHPV